MITNYLLGIFCEAFAFIVRVKWAIEDWKHRMEHEGNQ